VYIPQKRLIIRIIYRTDINFQLRAFALIDKLAGL